MADNVIWGTDFKAFPRPLSDEQKLSLIECFDGERRHVPFPPADTSPSEYTAPTDDCA